MTAPGSPALELRGISCTFVSKDAPGQRYTAVRDVDLTVAEGEFVSVVGPTGCGKSTLLNVAGGLLSPSSGDVRVFGKRLDDVEAFPDGLNIRAGYMFQAESLMPWRTALANVAAGLEFRGVADARRQADDWLRRVGLGGFGDRYPHQLSGGQRKRVGLAQVLIRNPKILLMDEPFGPLDAQTRQIMGSLLLDLWAQDRKAVMFVTHDLEEAIALSDRVVVMSAGPSAGIVGDYPVNLARPRDIAEIRLDPAFHAIHKQIWQSLKVEVQKAYAAGDGKDM